MPAETVSIFEVHDYETPLRRAVEIVRQGGLVVLPTETVYGSAGLLTHAAARDRLKALRNSPDAKPLTIHIAKAEDALQYIAPPGDLAKRMMRKLWPGPVGIRFDVPAERRAEVAKKLGIAEGDLYDNGQIALRCPDHPVAEHVIHEVAGPVAITASRAALRVSELAEVKEKVDLILDAGPTRFSKPSTIIHVTGHRYEIVRPGVYDERIIERLLKTTVLFICSGNTCRSPMAEAIARKIIADRLKVLPDEIEAKGFSVVSAGAFAMPGAKATPQAVDALRAMNIDLSKHRSRALSVELIHQADAIFTMSRAHAQAVISLVPAAREKTQTLDPDGDIEDPIGADVTVYAELAQALQPLIDKRLKEGVLP